MFSALARKIFGTANERLIKSIQPDIDRINALEAGISQLTDAELRAKTAEFKTRLAQGETVDDLLPEAFAVVREAAKRTLGLRHYDVQLIGGIILHRGMITEMKTGEGKTLVATLPVYLNALEGKGVHVVTVNDYLAHRDADWMGAVYRFLGMEVGCIVHNMRESDRRAAYAADITYGTNNEFGFDYLRDNMRYAMSELVQRGYHYAIIDEVDSILIDEARTPLIISGPTEDNSSLYMTLDAYIPLLTEDHFEIDEKSKAATFTDAGVEFLEEKLREDGHIGQESSLYDIENVSFVHHLTQAMKAHKLFTLDVDYLVHDGKVVIVDEFTGRMMEGRRYSEGLHQALEAKEKVQIQNENQTLASITFQNYFRLYTKLAGMTGTAMTEANEFMDIYKLSVIDVPTHRPVSRIDHDDVVYRTTREKFEAILELIAERHAKNQPILVGTVSIEKSEMLAKLLKQKKIPHEVLNAKYHEKEAYIIAQAGRPGAVTIATNMAGRGTDIMLGGNAELMILKKLGDNLEDDPKYRERADHIRQQVEADKQKVIEAGGLYILATERHESRRIDNQLRGRSGRQGDPGESTFFLSLEDDLMRIFGSERIDALLQKLGMQEGEAIFHPWMNRALEKAQQRVESRNYDIRKNLLKFDDVMNDQRKVIFEQRLDIMESDEVEDTIKEMRDDVIEDLVGQHIPARSYAEQWDMQGLHTEVLSIFGLDLPVQEWAKEEGIAEQEIHQRLQQQVEALFQSKTESFGVDAVRVAEKRLLLLTLDRLWKDHLLSLDHLRQGISLRAYGQRDPLNEYKQEAFSLFEQMLHQLRVEVTRWLSHLHISLESEEALRPFPKPSQQQMHETRIDPAMQADPFQRPTVNDVAMMQRHVQVAPEDRDPADPETWGKIGRNEACPCGSSKKYKHCHGSIA